MSRVAHSLLLLCQAYKFFYWFCFPTLVSYRAVRLGPVQPLSALYSEAQLRQLREQFGAVRVAALVQCEPDGRLAVAELRPPAQGAAVTVAAADPSTLEENPGWSARGLLQLLHGRWGVSRARLLLLRDHVADPALRRGRALELRFEAEPAVAAAGGWEKDVKGTSKPRMVHLAAQMDPKKLLTTAVDLNLKLMK